MGRRLLRFFQDHRTRQKVSVAPMLDRVSPSKQHLLSAASLRILYSSIQSFGLSVVNPYVLEKLKRYVPSEFVEREVSLLPQCLHTRVSLIQVCKANRCRICGSVFYRRTVDHTLSTVGDPGKAGHLRITAHSSCCACSQD